MAENMAAGSQPCAEAADDSSRSNPQVRARKRQTMEMVRLRVYPQAQQGRISSFFPSSSVYQILKYMSQRAILTQTTLRECSKGTTALTSVVLEKTDILP